MKKKIAAVLMIVLTLSLIMGTVAYAEGSDSGNGSGSQPSDQVQPSSPAQPSDQAQPSNPTKADRAAKKAERLKFKADVQALIQEIKNNHEQVKTLKQEFAALRLQVKEHMAALKQNPGSLTDEQIQLLKTLKTQLGESKDALIRTNITMSQERLSLRQARRAKNHEAILAAYGNIITIQKERMELLGNMKGICQQIIAVG